MRDDKARKARRAEYLQSKPKSASDWVPLLDSRYKSEGFEEMFVIVADAKKLGIIGAVPRANKYLTANLELALANGYAVIGVGGLRPEGNGFRVYASPIIEYENTPSVLKRIDYVRNHIDTMMTDKNLHNFESPVVN